MQDYLSGGNDQRMQWMTVREASQYLQVKPRTLLAWVRAGRVKAYALSGTRRRIWRFLGEDLDAALLENPVLPSPGCLCASTERGIPQ